MDLCLYLQALFKYLPSWLVFWTLLRQIRKGTSGLFLHHHCLKPSRCGCWASKDHTQRGSVACPQGSQDLPFPAQIQAAWPTATCYQSTVPLGKSPSGDGLKMSTLSTGRPLDKSLCHLHYVTNSSNFKNWAKGSASLILIPKPTRCLPEAAISSFNAPWHITVGGHRSMSSCPPWPH